MKDDAKVFMLLASVKAENKVVIGELYVVCDFPKVFPYDISDLLSKCEVEFAIDLIHGTSLVSMPPYRMSTLELHELKKQLEDMLEKKFVRPSVSLCGAPVLMVKK